MYEKDGISKDEVVSIVNTFPNQGNARMFVSLKFRPWCTEREGETVRIQVNFPLGEFTKLSYRSHFQLVITLQDPKDIKLN